MAMTNKFKRYYEAVDFLEGLINLPLQGDYMIDHNNPEVYLKRMRYFLDLIGKPDKGFKFIHIAGTSGKGSVTNMVHEALLASGKKVGSFTSPCVVTSIEKIRVGDLYISPDEFADVVEYLKPFIDEAYMIGPYGRPSYFEIFLAIALVYFKRQRCEWVVLEVGLGGRFDATNVIEAPLVTAITNIDYDHTEILGKTLQKIAFDKAGIIKSGAMFFTTEQNKSVLKVFAKVCKEKKVAMNVLPERVDYKDYNRELVTAISRHIGIADGAIALGIKRSKLMCRFETVQPKPMVVIDGAHNRAKMKATVSNLEKLNYKKLILIVGIADNKDHISILEQIVPLADRVLFTRFQNKDRKCAHPKDLFEKSEKYFNKGINCKNTLGKRASSANRGDVGVFLDAGNALSKALEVADKNDLILITGSFFLAGELRKKWFPEEVILERRKI